MSEQQPARGYSPEQTARLADRTNLILRMLRGDAPALTLDALLSAYATVAVSVGRGKESARMLRTLSGILEANDGPEDFQKAIDGIPAAVLKAPMPERPTGTLPDGYAADDVARIEALVRSVLDLVEGEKGHNALSALITGYQQVADHLGERAKAGRVLLETGGRMLAQREPDPGQAAAPVPTTTAKLH